MKLLQLAAARIRRSHAPLVRGMYALVLCLVSWIGSSSLLQAQGAPGSNDPTFNVVDDGTFGNGLGLNGAATSVVLQPDGKFLIGGAFPSYNGTLRNCIVRVNADGSLDTSFNTASGLSGTDVVYALALQQDGKILIGGEFSSYNGTPRNKIARLNTDGSLDPSFNPGSGVGGVAILALTLQPDGKIVIGGQFTSYNGIPRNSIARLNSDGSLDTSFDPGAGPGSGYPVFAVATQAGGKVLIGGGFTTYNGSPRFCLARANNDGSVDNSFNSNPGTGPNGNVRAFAVHPDGKVTIGGQYTTYDGISRSRIARINYDGSLDASFNPGSGANEVIDFITLQADGKALIGGMFTTYNGISRSMIARIGVDGSLDMNFDPGLGGFHTSVTGTINAIALQPNGSVLLGGYFASYNGIDRNCIARIYANGSIDLSFNPPQGLNNRALASVRQPDGKALICGEFTTCNGYPRSRIARLNNDGSLDMSFDPGVGPNGFVSTIAAQPDGKVLIGGSFTSYASSPRNRIARLNSDGSLDNSFNPNTGFDGRVHSMVLQPDGKVLIGGSFTNYGGLPRNRIARINSDGSLDNSFNPGTGANSYVERVALAPDGKLYIGGDFTSYNGLPRIRIARLNSDGSLDNSFDPGTGFDATVRSMALQSDGKVLIGGYFATFNGIPRSGVVRLNIDGALDVGFDPGAGTGANVQAIALQPDGKVLIGGFFLTYNGSPRNRIARVNNDGSLDSSFDPGIGANGRVWSLVLEPGGKVMIGGDFNSYNGTVRTRLARIHAYEPYATYCDGPTLACPCGNVGAAGNGCANSVNAAGANLAASGVASLANDTLVLAASGMPNSSALYFQGTTQSSSAFGDGVRCAAGTIIRLGAKASIAGASSFPAAGDQRISVRGAIAASGVRQYQVWYRNAAAFCTPSTFNLTNGVSVNWAP